MIDKDKEIFMVNRELRSLIKVFTGIYISTRQLKEGNMKGLFGFWLVGFCFFGFVLFLPLLAVILLFFLLNN